MKIQIVNDDVASKDPLLGEMQSLSTIYVFIFPILLILIGFFNY